MRKRILKRHFTVCAVSVVAEQIERRLLMSTYTVNTLSDAINPGAGLVTFRQAVADANGHAGADTVAFSSTVFASGSQHKITLTQGQISFTDTSGATTVTGPGSGTATIDGNGKSRLFSIAASADVSMSGLTLTGGKQTVADSSGNTHGGAIDSAGTLTISNCTISKNSVVASGTTGDSPDSLSAGEGLGGAIYSTGKLTVSASLLAANTVTNLALVSDLNGPAPVGSGAAYGGAIYTTGVLSLTDDSISGNSLTASNAGSIESDGIGGGPVAGGGVFASATVTVLRTTISGNTATAGYPAGYSGSDGSNAEGGGIYAGSSITITESSVTSNVATASGSSFDEGISGVARGGGVYAGGKATITASNIGNNNAVAGDTDSSDSVSGGGGLFAAFDATLTNDHIDLNAVKGGTGGDAIATTAGGGVYGGGKITVLNSSISGNSVTSQMDTFVTQYRFGGVNVGGGIAVIAQSTITGSTIANNSVSGGNGHDAYSGYAATDAGDGRGGGIYNSSTLTLANSTVANNTATGGNGGAADNQEAGKNGANGLGGGIYNVGALVVSESTISGNTAKAGIAGEDFYTGPDDPSSPGGSPGTANAGGVDIAAGSALFNNSIISANISAAAFSDIFGSADPDSASNLIGVGGGINNNAIGNKVGVNDPKLSPLGNNGGPTLTMIPLIGSPVIDAGQGSLVPVGRNTDQRGFPRVAGSAVDIGATELSFSSISGTVFNDANGNTKQDSGELGRALITIYNDANNNGILDSGELSVVTDAAGHYIFANANPGNYKIRQILPSNWKQTTPANGFGWTIMLIGNGTASTGNNFGQQSTAPIGGSISGTVFNDLDGNGAQTAGETGRGAGITIYNDANNNGVLDSGELTTTTDANGNYTLTNLPVGNYKIREILPAGWKQTAPANNFGYTLTLSANQTLTAKNFGEESTVAPPVGGSISGTVFNDSNGNLKQDSGELGLSAWTLFIDANNDGILDNGELSTQTKADGSYVFSSLTAGAYLIRAIRPSGWSQTAPSNNFGQHVTIAANQAKTGVSFGERQII